MTKHNNTLSILLDFLEIGGDPKQEGSVILYWSSCVFQAR